MRSILVLLVWIGSTAKGHSQTPYLDSLLQIVAKHPRDTNEIRALDLIADEYMRTDAEKAKLYCHKEIALAKELNTIFGLPWGYAGLVALHQGEGRMDSAAYYLGQLKQLSSDHPTNKKVILNYYNTAGVFYKQQGKYKEALPYLLQTVKYIDPKNNKTNLGGAYLNIGNLYFSLGELKKAADYHLKALALFEELNHKRGQSFILQGLGEDFIALKQYPLAEKYLLQSSQLKEALGDRRGALTSWQSLGRAHQQMNHFTLAMAYFKKALARAQELKLQIEEMRILYNMGTLLKATNKNDEAKKAFLASMAFAQQQGDSIVVSNARAALVMMDANTRNPTDEEDALATNIKTSLEKGDRLNAALGYFTLSDWYATQKEYKKAFEHLKRGQMLNDSVRGNQIIVEFKKLEEEYNSVKREKEIALLKKDRELQQQALQRRNQLMLGAVILALLALGSIWLWMSRSRLRQRMKELELRNSIAADLHDEVGSSLSSIHMLSQMALRPGNEPAQKGILEKMSGNAVETMDRMSDIVWMIKPSDTEAGSLKQRLERFAYEMGSSQPINIGWQLEALDDLEFTMNEKKNVCLIYKEALNNAVKYSEAEKIEVKACVKNKKLELSIVDDGKGFDRLTVKKGNGLSNMQHRASELRAQLLIDTKIGAGTTIRLVLPV
jgi:signal transduction histidine kinase